MKLHSMMNEGFSDGQRWKRFNFMGKPFFQRNRINARGVNSDVMAQNTLLSACMLYYLLNNSNAHFQISHTIIRYTVCGNGRNEHGAVR